MRLWISLLAGLGLTACGEDDPRVVLCKSAVTESVDRFQRFGEVTIQEIEARASLEKLPDLPDEKGSEFFVPGSPDRFAVLLLFHFTDAEGKPISSEAMCRFRPDSVHGYRASTIEILKRRIEEDDAYRLTQRHLPAGAWVSYACKWYRKI